MDTYKPFFLIVIFLTILAPGKGLLWAEAARKFLPALPGYDYEFPRDHGSHPQYQTEWWYYTGHLRTASGKEYGFELTFFRVGVAGDGSPSSNPWELRDVGLAHFAITDVGRKRFRFHQRLNRLSPYTADARIGSLHVFNEGWSVTTTSDGRIRLRAAAEGDTIDLVVRSEKPPSVHGTNGVSVKAEGIGYASHYYSLTRLTGSGTVGAQGLTESCTVLAWMDHEFGSSTLRENQSGWDWFSAQLDNGTELMIYVIRKRDGSPDKTSSGSIVLQDGTVIHLEPSQFTITSRRRWRSPRSGATYPVGWIVEVRPLNVRVELTERLKEQELITTSSTGINYWEGAVSVMGSFGDTPVRGVGYVEMTGYDRPFGR